VVLTNRLARIIDRARQLQAGLQGTALAISRENRLELKVQKQRMDLVLKAIELCTVTILLVAVVVAVVFISAVTAVDLALVVVPLFVLAMLCLMAASVLFLREVQLAARQIRRWF
jgi:predicted membrane channel-forming protein YqfA (hemolysin III family)